MKLLPVNQAGAYYAASALTLTAPLEAHCGKKT
jgi:hypothetical protein